jgi:hypothetical protein
MITMAIRRRTFLQTAFATAAMLGPARLLAGQPDRHGGGWIIPTNTPDRFGLKVMAFNPIRVPDPAA